MLQRRMAMLLPWAVAFLSCEPDGDEAAVGATPEPVLEQASDGAAIDEPQQERQPVRVVPGAQLGPIHIGMSVHELRELGHGQVDPRTGWIHMGPYRIQLGSERTVEAAAISLEAGQAVLLDERTLHIDESLESLLESLGTCEQHTVARTELYHCMAGAVQLTVSASTGEQERERVTLTVRRPAMTAMGPSRREPAG